MNIKTILATKGANVITIAPEKTVRDALETLVGHNIGALVVVDTSNKPVGIISERDVVRLAAKNEQFFLVAVGQVMTTHVITCIPQDEIRAIANVMTEQRIRHLPVVDADGTLIGIVSIGDIVKAERDQFEGEADTLRTQILADAV